MEVNDRRLSMLFVVGKRHRIVLTLSHVIVDRTKESDTRRPMLRIPKTPTSIATPYPAPIRSAVGMYDTSLSFNANQNTRTAAAFATAWAASCPPIVILVSHEKECRGGGRGLLGKLWLRWLFTYYFTHTLPIPITYLILREQSGSVQTF